MADEPRSSWRRKWAAPDLRHERALQRGSSRSSARRPRPASAPAPRWPALSHQTSTSSEQARRTQSRWDLGAEHVVRPSQLS